MGENESLEQSTTTPETGDPAPPTEGDQTAEQGREPEVPETPEAKAEETETEEEIAQRKQANREAFERRTGISAEDEQEDQGYRPQDRQAPVIGAERPNVDDYENYTDYEDALDDWRYNQRQIKEKAVQIQTKVEQARLNDPEFEQKHFIPIANNGLFEQVMDSPQWQEISAFFRQNLNIANQFAQMHPVQVAREIGRLEARLEKPTIPQRTQTRAPAATTELPTGVETAEKSQEEMSTDEWFAARKAGRI